MKSTFYVTMRESGRGWEGEGGLLALKGEVKSNETKARKTGKVHNCM